MKALSISPFFAKYIAAWASFCLVAILILVRDRKRLLPEWREYSEFPQCAMEVVLVRTCISLRGHSGSLHKR